MFKLEREPESFYHRYHIQREGAVCPSRARSEKCQLI